MRDHGHPLFARYYARASELIEPRLAEHRKALLANLTGRVIEVGAGNGLNFAHYPNTVTEVLALEPEPHLRKIAQRKATEAPVPIKVTTGTAEALPAENESYDAAVTSLVLCTVKDPAAALAELRRVLKPAADLRFFEHVQAKTPGRRRIQRALDATIYPFLTGGCHCSRDTRKTIEHAGFTTIQLTHLGAPETGLPFPATPQILGRATRKT